MTNDEIRNYAIDTLATVCKIGQPHDRIVAAQAMLHGSAAKMTVPRGLCGSSRTPMARLWR